MGDLIRELRLENFRGFEKFTVDFPSPCILVGANNAGKSTVIAALRLATQMIRDGQRRRAPQSRRIDGEEIGIHPFTAEHFDLQDENLRFEFRYSTQTSFQLNFENGSQLRATWPKRRAQPYFFFRNSSGAVLEVPSAVETAFSSIGTIPPLSPLDLREGKLTERWVQLNMSTRLASRHFRNQLRSLDRRGQWEDFATFCERWTNGLRLERPRLQELDDESSIDVFFHEGRGPKELAWVGDGVQIFLQLLLHLYRLRGTETVVLDEPEVYLHPDLQRRLIRVLNEVTSQFVIATHSPEIVAEASPENVVLIERTRRRSVRIHTSEEAGDISEALGSIFDLRMARAFRTHVTLFVEGKDAAILRHLATTLGAMRFANEDGITVAKINGVGNWQITKGLPWLTNSVFEGAFEGFVLLDRDMLSDSARAERQRQLRVSGLRCHIWQRRELESYLLDPRAIARLTGLEPTLVETIIEEELDGLRTEIEDQLIAERIQDPDRDRTQHSKNVIQAARQELKATWTTTESKLTYCPSKALIRSINRRLQEKGHSTISVNALSRHLRVEEIPEEMARVLMRIEEILEGDQEMSGR